MMKKLILGLALLSTSAMAATPSSMIFNEVFLKKGTGEMGLQLIVNRDVKTWCVGYGSQLSVGTFEVGEKVDGLANGLYKCEGKFFQIRAEHTTPIQAFEIGTCSEINPVELKADCPPRK